MAAITILQTATASVTAATVISPVFGTAPSEGSIMVGFWSAPDCGHANLSLSGSPWNQSGSNQATTSTAGMKGVWKQATASESATQTFTATVACNSRITLFELSGAENVGPQAWNDFVTGGTSLTVEPETDHTNAYVLTVFQAAIASPGYLNTWTDGWTQQSLLGSSHTVAARATNSPGVYSTQETWTTSCNVRSLSFDIRVADPLRVLLVHASTAEAAASTSLALNGGDGAGAAVTTGDVRVAFFATKNGAYPELNTPSGWTGIESIGDTAPAVRAIYHVAGTGEKTGLTLTSTTSRDLMVFQYIFTKPNQESPVGQTSTASVTSATQLTSSIVTLEEAAAIVVVFAAYNGNISALGWTNGFIDYAGVNATASAIKSVSDIDSYSTTVSWTTARTARAIALVVKQELTPLVAGDGWGISS